MPATINQLDAGTREGLERIVLLSVGRKADFEFHVSNWLGGGGDGLPIAPEVARCRQKTLCVFGDKDEDALCPTCRPMTGEAGEAAGRPPFRR